MGSARGGGTVAVTKGRDGVGSCRTVRKGVSN